MSAQASRKEKTVEDSIFKSAMLWGSLEEMWSWNVPQTGIITIMMTFQDSIGFSAEYLLRWFLNYQRELNKIKIPYVYSLVHKANKSMYFILSSHMKTPVTNVVTVLVFLYLWTAINQSSFNLYFTDNSSIWHSNYLNLKYAHQEIGILNMNEMSNGICYI